MPDQKNICENAVVCGGLMFICTFYVLIESKYVVHTPTKLLLLSLSFKTVGSRWFEAECMTNKKKSILLASV